VPGAGGRSGPRAGPDGATATTGTPIRPAPQLTGTTTTGGRADLAALRGHPVLVTVWASWCRPCRQELPVLASARSRYAGQGVQFLGILTRDTASDGNALLASTGASGLVSVLDPDGSIAVSWGATGVPETFVVDGDGVIRARLVGPVTAASIDGHLHPLLAG
jgi:cytochrome c biogenesis protein CcmG/thiol:disulfide interchange protein DsbE